MAENKGFEPSDAYTSPPFQDGALSRSANSPSAILLYIKALVYSIIVELFYRYIPQYCLNTNPQSFL